MNKNQVKIDLFDSKMQKGTNCLASKNQQKIFSAINWFKKALKDARNNNEQARALQMLGKAQYCLKQYTKSEKSFRSALEKATDDALIDHIYFDIAMVSLHITGKIWVMHDDNMSWIFSVTRAKRWQYILKSIIHSIRTGNKNSFKQTCKIITTMLTSTP